MTRVEVAAPLRAGRGRAPGRVRRLLRRRAAPADRPGPRAGARPRRGGRRPGGDAGGLPPMAGHLSAGATRPVGTTHLRQPRRLPVPPPDGRASRHSEAGRSGNRPQAQRGRREFWAAVRSLPHRQAQAAALRFVYDMPLAEIATTLGTSEGTVKQHLSRARRSLAAVSRLSATTTGRAMTDLDTLARAATQELLDRTSPRREDLVRRPATHPDPADDRESLAVGRGGRGSDRGLAAGLAARGDRAARASSRGPGSKTGVLLAPPRGTPSATDEQWRLAPGRTPVDNLPLRHCSFFAQYQFTAWTGTEIVLRRPARPG